MINNRKLIPFLTLCATLMISACSDSEKDPKNLSAGNDGAKIFYDVIIRNVTIYDGSGNPPYQSDLAIIDDRIAAIGAFATSDAALEIDATGKAVSPGFINMMGWGGALIKDGRSNSNLTQGITLEVFGEGDSMGPLNKEMKAGALRTLGVEPPWSTLDEYLVYITEDVGISLNVASLIGATTPRIYVLGKDDIVPTPDQLVEMKNLVRDSMRDDALGVALSLIYTPGAFASPEELTALASAAGEYGVFTFHICVMRAKISLRHWMNC